MHAWRAIVILLLALNAVFAAASDFKPLVPVVAVVVIAGLVMTDMLAAAISNPQLEAWAKTEIREVIAGAVLIAIVIAFFISSQGISVALTGDTNYVHKAQNITNNWTTKLTSAYDQVIEAAALIRVAATYSSGTNVAIYWVSLSYQTSPLGGASVFLVPLSLATQGLSNAIYLSEAIRLLLTFFNVVMPSILLPISFCIRLIPFTRKLGNTLIALCLAGMIFLPLSVIMAEYLNDQIKLPNPHISDMGALDSDPYPVYIFGPICEFKPMRILFSLTDPVFALIVCLPIAWIPGAFPACFNTVWQVVYPIMSMVFQWANVALLIPWEAAVNPAVYGSGVYRELQPFLKDVSNLVMVIYLDIVLITIVTVSGARSLAAVLGGEWYMAGIQRLI